MGFGVFWVFFVLFFVLLWLGIAAESCIQLLQTVSSFEHSLLSSICPFTVPLVKEESEIVFPIQKFIKSRADEASFGDAYF